MKDVICVSRKRRDTLFFRLCYDNTVIQCIVSISVSVFLIECATGTAVWLQVIFQEC